MNRNKKFLLFSFFFVFGIFVSSFLNVENWLLFCLSAFFVFLTFILEAEEWKIVGLCLLFLFLGAIRFGLFEGDLNSTRMDIGFLDGEEVRLVGKIAESPKVKGGTQQVVIEINDKNLPRFKILSHISAYKTVNYGDNVEFRGKLSIPKNFEDFDYKNYLLNKGIYYVSYYPEITVRQNNDRGIFALVDNFRLDASNRFARILPEPHANILSAMILGIKSSIPEDVLNDFGRTGTRHIVVVSGAHMVIIVTMMVFTFLLAGVNRKSVFYLVSTGIIAFIILVGAAPSAIRAGIMAFTLLFSYKIGRLNKSFSALVLAAVLMLVVNPGLLINDLSFQLSFLATFGIILFFPYLKEKFKKIPELVGVKNIFFVTLSAQIGIFPILVTNFDGFSIFSFLVNILILPVMPFLMVGGFVLLFISFVSISLAQVLALPIYLLLSYQLIVVKFFADINFGFIQF